MNIARITTNTPWIRSVFQKVMSFLFTLAIIRIISILITNIHCIDGVLIVNEEIICWSTLSHTIIVSFSLVFLVLISVHLLLYKFFIHSFFLKRAGLLAHFSPFFSCFLSSYVLLQVYIIFILKYLLL
jgi:hypothetical protein